MISVLPVLPWSYFQSRVTRLKVVDVLDFNKRGQLFVTLPKMCWDLCPARQDRPLPLLPP